MSELVAGALYIGTIFQSLLTAQGLKKEELFRWLLLCLTSIAGGFIGALIIGQLTTLFAIASIIYVLGFALSGWFFERLLRTINLTILLTWFIILFYLTINRYDLSGLILTPLAFIILLVSINAVAKALKSSEVKRAGYYVVFLGIFTGLSWFIGQDFWPIYQSMLTNGNIDNSFNMATGLLAGMNFFLFAVYCVTLLKIRYGSQDISRTSAIMAARYNDKNSPKRTTFYFIVVVLALGSNFLFHTLTPALAASIAIVVLSIFQYPSDTKPVKTLHKPKRS